jgi:hypothetical protein
VISKLQLGCALLFTPDTRYCVGTCDSPTFEPEINEAKAIRIPQPALGHLPRKWQRDMTKGKERRWWWKVQTRKETMSLLGGQFAVESRLCVTKKPFRDKKENLVGQCIYRGLHMRWRRWNVGCHGNVGGY